MPVRQKMNIDLPSDIEDIHKHMKKRKKQLYVVGGAIRDELMGEVPKDYDLSTNATPDEVINILEFYVKQVNKIGDQFPVVMVRTHDGNDYEIATFRKDERVHKDSDDKKVVIKNVTVDQDVLRRDLTINALFYDIDTKEIVDYVGGIDDVQNGIVRSVGNPAHRFYEDKSRILRAVRFAARLGSEIDNETAEAIINDAGLREGDIGAIRAEERITEEFKKGIATSQDPSVYVRMLNDLGLLDEIFPGMITDDSPSSSRDVDIQLALILKGNDPDSVRDILNRIRHSSETTARTSFLLNFLNMDRDSAPQIKKEFKRRKIDPDSLREFMSHAKGPNERVVEGFLSFVASEPTVNPRDLMSQGLKGPEIGLAMNQAEKDSYSQIIDSLRENIKRILLTENVSDDLVQFIIKSNEIEGYHVNRLDVIDALEGIDAGYPISYVSTNPHITGHLAGLGAVNEKNPRTLEAAIAVHAAMGPQVLESGVPGIIRSGIEARSGGGIHYASSADIPTAMKWWEDQEFSSPFVRHAMYELIHPFADGNGRSGRILLAADMGFDLGTVNKMISNRSQYIDALNSVRENYSGDFWNSSEDDHKVLEKMIKEILIDSIQSGILVEVDDSHPEEPDLLHFSESLNSMISSMIFRQDLIDHLNNSQADMEINTVLDTGELFQNYDTVDEVHLGIIINDEGTGKISAYYNCVVDDRSKSNLIIVLDIPRNYEKVDGFKRWLSIELEGVLSHELQHSCDPTEMLAADIPEGEAKWESPENILKHFGSQAETRGNVAEIVGRARISGEDTGDILDEYVNSIVEDGWRRGFEQEEMIPIAQEIWKRWDARLQELIQVNEAKKKKKKKSKKHVEKTYKLGTKKSLDLNKTTSHGGWPEGPSKSFMSDKPVNKQISDWLKGMSMISETPSYFGGGFSNFKQFVDSGMNAIEAAEKAGFKRVQGGYSRFVYEHPTAKEFVLKIAHGMGNRWRNSETWKGDADVDGDISLARRTNIAEAQSGRGNIFDIFPKVYPGDPAGNWILSEKVNILSSPQEMSEFFPEMKFPNEQMMWILLLDMGSKYSKEIEEIHNSGDWSSEPVRFKKQIEQLGSNPIGAKVANRFLELWENPTFRTVSKAMSNIGIAPHEMRHDNVGYVIRNGNKEFVILDVSVGLEGTESQIDSDETFGV